MPRAPVIAIDGPAGAGKSTAARALARRLGVPYLDTGAMYRAIALVVLEAGVAIPLDEDGERLAIEAVRAAKLRLDGGPVAPRVWVNGRDVSAAIRSPEVSRAASVVSEVPKVRRELVRLQRRLGRASGGVVEGRDIGTVVFPDAELKVFLTASVEERARRRYVELKKRGVDVELAQVMAEQSERDERDADRAEAPMRPAHDAIILDTSGLPLEAVVSRLLELVAATLGP